MPDMPTQHAGALNDTDEAPTLHATAYAKLNLALHVTGRRADGYHLLDSLVAFADYGDAISVRLAEKDNFTLCGRFGQNLPVDGKNLAIKARDLLRAYYPHQAPAVAIHLEKKLPVASGIGSGSGDAAAVLTLLLRLWNIRPDPATLQHICLQLGADVPMCLHGQLYGGGVIARGIGEELQAIPDLPALPLVLVNDGTAIATPQIFQQLQKRDNPPLPDLHSVRNHTDLCNYLASTRNDLFEPAMRLAPQLPQILQLLRQSGALLAQMSGSGATCFGIYATQTAAQQAAVFLHEHYPHWFICYTNTLSSHPEHSGQGLPDKPIRTGLAGQASQQASPGGRQ